MGETGEALLGITAGDRIQYLSPRRFKTDMGDSMLRTSSDDRVQPMAAAVSGSIGVIRAHDYRNEKVLAAFRPIPSMNWGLVTKQDEKEAFREINRTRTIIVLGAFLLLVILIAVALPVVRIFLRPLRELETATRKLAKGEYDALVPVDRLDETGRGSGRGSWT